MSIFSKIASIFTGTVTEAGQSFVDSKGDVLLRQQLRDSKEEMSAAKTSLVSLMATQKGLEEEVKNLRKKKVDGTAAATTAMEKGDETTALKLMDGLESKIIPELTRKEAMLSTLTSQVDKVKKSQRIAEENINNFESRIKMLAAQEKTNKATKMANASTININSKSSEMQDTLSRLEERSKQDELEIVSAQELDSESRNEDFDSLVNSVNTTSTDGMSAADRLKALQGK